MPAESTTIVTPTSDVQSATPESEGMARFMEDFNEPEVAPAPAGDKQPEKPADKPKVEPEKPAEKVTPIPADKKPDPKPADKPKEDGIATLRKRHEEVLKADREKAALIANHEKKIRELEAKVPSEDVLKKIEAHEARLKELQGKLASTDYSQSDEFKTKFLVPWERMTKEAAELASRMKVTEGDGERMGKPGDFQRIFNADAADQAGLAQELFGVNGIRILQQIDRMQTLRRESDEAIQSAAQNLSKKQEEQRAAMERDERDYNQFYEESKQALEKQYPHLFAAPEDNPEIAEAMRKGYEYVDGLLSQLNTATAMDRAGIAAVLRARAAYGNRAVTELKSANAKVEALEKELAKYRGGSPGAEREGSGAQGGEGAAKAVGLEALAAEIDKAAKSFD